MSSTSTATTPSTSQQPAKQQHETPTLNSLLQKPVASISSSQANQNPYSAPTPPFGASGPPQVTDLVGAVAPASLAFDPRWAAAAAAAAATTGRYPANMPPNDNSKNVTTAEAMANQIKMHQAGMIPSFMTGGGGVPPYQTLPLRPHGQFAGSTGPGTPVYMTASLPQQYNPHSFMSPLNIPTLSSTTAGTPPARFGYQQQQQTSDVPTSNGLESKPKSAASSFPNSPAAAHSSSNHGINAQKDQQQTSGPKQHPAVTALKQESGAEKSPGVELLQQSSSRSPSVSSSHTPAGASEAARSSPAATATVQQMRHSPVSPATAPAFALGPNPQHQFPPNVLPQQQAPFNAAVPYQVQYPVGAFNGPTGTGGGRFRGPVYMDAYRQMAYGGVNNPQQPGGNMVYSLPPHPSSKMFVRNGMIQSQNFQIYGEDTKQGLNGRNTPSVNTNSSDSRLSSTPLAGESKASFSKLVNHAKDSHPSTPAMLNSPGDATDEAESSLSSPSWHGTPMSPANSTRHSSSSHTSNRPPPGILMPNNPPPPATMNMGGAPCPPTGAAPQQPPVHRQNLIDRLVGDVQGGHFAEWDERRRFMDHYVQFCEMQGVQNTLYQQLASGHPTVSKQPVDLFILYKFVKQNGGYVQCSKKRAWREMCKVFNVNESNSASGQIKKQYAKFVLPYECFYDLNKSDPEPLIRMCESKKKPKKEKPPPTPQQQAAAPMTPQSLPPNFSLEPGNVYQQQQGNATAVSYLGPGNLQTAQPHFFATPSPRPPENESTTPKRPPSQSKTTKKQKRQSSISNVVTSASLSNDVPSSSSRLPLNVTQQMSIESAVNPFDDSVVKPNAAQRQRLLEPTAPGAQFHQVCRPPLPYGDPNLIEQKLNAKAGQPFPLPAQPQQQQQVSNTEYAAAVNHQPPAAQPGSSNQPPTSSSTYYNGSAAPAAAHFQPSVDNNGGGGGGFLKPQQPPPPPQQQQPWTPYGGPPQPHYYGQNAAGSAAHLPPVAAHRTQIPPSGMSNAYPYNSMNASSARTVIDPSIKVKNNQVQGPKYGMVQPYGPTLRKESPLSPTCVEATGVKVAKRKKILAKDIQKVDLWRLIMALKSGLHFETSWALNILTVLLYDDSTVNFFDLSNMPGFVSVLVETLKRYLDFFAEKIVSPPTKTRATTPPPVVVASSNAADDYAAATPCLTILKRSKTSNSTIIVKDDVQDRAASPLEEENLAAAVDVDENADDPCDKLGVFLSDISKRKRRQCCRQSLDDDDAAPSTKRSKEYWENDRKDERSVRQSAWRMFGGDDDRTARRPLDVCSTILGILRALVYIPDNENLMVNKNVAPSVKLVKILTQILALGAECLDADQKPVPPDQRPKKWPPTDAEEDNAETPATAQDTPIRLDDSLFFYDDLLRLCDDALVILCHLASCLDFYDYPEPMVERLFSLLIRWTLFKTAGQSDLVGGVFSLPVLLTTANQNELLGGACVVGQSYFSTPPNRCALEVLCKLTVFERNVDLLLATPPRRNIERFMRKLVALLAPGPASILGVPHNDPILREMALVIVASMCQASPESCRFFALETAMVERLATFLEQANSDMLRVAQTHSLQTLRDNPEIIGTSVGMLRRAAKALLCTSKSDLTAECKSKFKPHLSKFITITMSQLMDSRVGHTVAEILYELQQEAAVC